MVAFYSFICIFLELPSYCLIKASSVYWVSGTGRADSLEPCRICPVHWNAQAFREDGHDCISSSGVRGVSVVGVQFPAYSSLSCPVDRHLCRGLWAEALWGKDSEGENNSERGLCVREQYAPRLSVCPVYRPQRANRSLWSDERLGRTRLWNSW